MGRAGARARGWVETSGSTRCKPRRCSSSCLTWRVGTKLGARTPPVTKLLSEIPSIVRPTVREYNESIFNQYVIRIPRADACREHLRRNGIGCEIYYPLGLHQHECFASLGYGKGDFPESERAATESLAIPIHPALTQQQIAHVVEQLSVFAKSEPSPS